MNLSVDYIVGKHDKFLKKIGIQMLDKNRNLPYLYITPKQHKSSIGFRYITSGAACSLQQLSKYIGICLKSLLHSAKNKSIYDNKFHIRNDYYVIDNNEPVLDFINSDNLKKGGKSVSTYDFSTLYTSIPHDQLTNSLINFISRIFKVKNKSYIIPNLSNKKAYFSDSLNSKNKVYFSKDTLIECVNYLVLNL